MSFDLQAMSVDHCASYVSYLVNSNSIVEEKAHELIRSLLIKCQIASIDEVIIKIIVENIRHVVILNRECPNVIGSVLDYVAYIPTSLSYLLLDDIMTSAPVITNKILIESIFDKLKDIVQNSQDGGIQLRALKIIIELNQANSGNKKQLKIYINILEYMLSSQNDDGTYALMQTDSTAIVKMVLKNLPNHAETAEKIVGIVLTQVALRDMSTVIGVLKVLLNYVSTSSLLANVIMGKLQECGVQAYGHTTADGAVDADGNADETVSEQKSACSAGFSISFLETCLYLSLFTLQRLMHSVSYVQDTSAASLGVTHLKLYAIAHNWMSCDAFPFDHMQQIVENLTNVEDVYVWKRLVKGAWKSCIWLYMSHYRANTRSMDAGSVFIRKKQLVYNWTHLQAILVNIYVVADLEMRSMILSNLLSCLDVRKRIAGQDRFVQQIVLKNLRRGMNTRDAQKASSPESALLGLGESSKLRCITQTLHPSSCCNNRYNIRQHTATIKMSHSESSSLDNSEQYDRCAVDLLCSICQRLCALSSATELSSVGASSSSISSDNTSGSMYATYSNIDNALELLNSSLLEYIKRALNSARMLQEQTHVGGVNLDGGLSGIGATSGRNEAIMCFPSSSVLQLLLGILMRQCTSGSQRRNAMSGENKMFMQKLLASCYGQERRNQPLWNNAPRIVSDKASNLFSFALKQFFVDTVAGSLSNDCYPEYVPMDRILWHRCRLLRKHSDKPIISIPRCVVKETNLGVLMAHFQQRRLVVDMMEIVSFFRVNYSLNASGGEYCTDPMGEALDLVKEQLVLFGEKMKETRILLDSVINCSSTSVSLLNGLFSESPPVSVSTSSKPIASLATLSKGTVSARSTYRAGDRGSAHSQTSANDTSYDEPNSPLLYCLDNICDVLANFVFMSHQFEELSSRYEALVDMENNYTSSFSGFVSYSAKDLNYGGKNSSVDSIEILKLVGKIFERTVDSLQLQFTSGSSYLKQSSYSVSSHCSMANSDEDESSDEDGRYDLYHSHATVFNSAYIEHPLVSRSMYLVPEYAPYYNPNPPSNFEKAGNQGKWVWNIAQLSAFQTLFFKKVGLLCQCPDVEQADQIDGNGTISDEIYLRGRDIVDEIVAEWEPIVAVACAQIEEMVPSVLWIVHFVSYLHDFFAYCCTNTLPDSHSHNSNNFGNGTEKECKLRLTSLLWPQIPLKDASEWLLFHEPLSVECGNLQGDMVSANFSPTLSKENAKNVKKGAGGHRVNAKESRTSYADMSPALLLQSIWERMLTISILLGRVRWASEHSSMHQDLLDSFREHTIVEILVSYSNQVQCTKYLFRLLQKSIANEWNRKLDKFADICGTDQGFVYLNHKGKCEPMPSDLYRDMMDMCHGYESSVVQLYVSVFNDMLNQFDNIFRNCRGAACKLLINDGLGQWSDMKHSAVNKENILDISAHLDATLFSEAHLLSNVGSLFVSAMGAIATKHRMKDGRQFFDSNSTRAKLWGGDNGTGFKSVMANSILSEMADNFNSDITALTPFDVALCQLFGSCLGIVEKVQALRLYEQEKKIAGSSPSKRRKRTEGVSDGVAKLASVVDVGETGGVKKGQVCAVPLSRYGCIVLLVSVYSMMMEKLEDIACALKILDSSSLYLDGVDSDAGSLDRIEYIQLFFAFLSHCCNVGLHCCKDMVSGAVRGNVVVHHLEAQLLKCTDAAVLFVGAKLLVSAVETTNCFNKVVLRSNSKSNDTVCDFQSVLSDSHCRKTLWKLGMLMFAENSLNSKQVPSLTGGPLPAINSQIILYPNQVQLYHHCYGVASANDRGHASKNKGKRANTLVSEAMSVESSSMQDFGLFLDDSSVNIENDESSIEPKEWQSLLPVMNNTWSHMMESGIFEGNTLFLLLHQQISSDIGSGRKSGMAKIRCNCSQFIFSSIIQISSRYAGASITSKKRKASDETASSHPNGNDRFDVMFFRYMFLNWFAVESVELRVFGVAYLMHEVLVTRAAVTANVTNLPENSESVNSSKSYSKFIGLSTGFMKRSTDVVSLNNYFITSLSLFPSLVTLTSSRYSPPPAGCIIISHTASGDQPPRYKYGVLYANAMKNNNLVYCKYSIERCGPYHSCAVVVTGFMWFLEQYSYILLDMKSESEISMETGVAFVSKTCSIVLRTCLLILDAVMHVALPQAVHWRNNFSYVRNKDSDWGHVYYLNQFILHMEMLHSNIRKFHDVIFSCCISGAGEDKKPCVSLPDSVVISAQKLLVRLDKCLVHHGSTVLGPLKKSHAMGRNGGNSDSTAAINSFVRCLDKYCISYCDNDKGAIAFGSGCVSLEEFKSMSANTEAAEDALNSGFGNIQSTGKGKCLYVQDNHIQDKIEQAPIDKYSFKVFESEPKEGNGFTVNIVEESIFSPAVSQNATNAEMYTTPPRATPVKRSSWGIYEPNTSAAPESLTGTPSPARSSRGRRGHIQGRSSLESL